MNCMSDISDELCSKYEHLKTILGQLESVLVAYSGGVDSTLLLKVAAQVLGDNVIAVTALSQTTPQHEKLDAKALARSMGVRHLEVESHEMAIPAFIENPADKCYVCKKSRFGELVALAAEEKIPWVVDGTNIDDDADYRPGSRAVRELGVRSPLREAGLTKEEIRLLSKALELPTWDKPAYACLASRIPYGQIITPEKLIQVDEGESLIRELGLCRQVRIRHEGDTARIEVEDEAIDRFMALDIRRRVISRLKALGFKFVALDLDGYQTGSLNRAIKTPTDPKGKTIREGAADG